ncbi:MAG: YCF48-related protein [Firmicutes bacterium]|nr:YCF48-related protein [Bacillota bacterium]
MNVLRTRRTGRAAVLFFILAAPLAASPLVAAAPRTAPRVAKGPTLPVPGEGSAALSVVSRSTIAAVVNGTLEISDNGGREWTQRALPANAASDALDFVSPTTGWLLAWTGPSLGRLAIYRTTDGGVRWQPQLVGPPTDNSGTLDMVSSQDGWAILHSTLYRTTDGGARWLPVALPPGVPTAASFVTARVGWVVIANNSGEGAAVWATSNGVRFRRILQSSLSIGAITLNRQGAGAVLEDGGPGNPNSLGPLLMTANGGKSWTVQTSSAALSRAAFGYATAMAFQGATGWIGTTNGAQGFSPSGLLVTANRGRTWHTVNGPEGWAIDGLALTGPGQGWIVAHGSTGLDFLAAIQDNGLHWQVVLPPAAPASADFLTPAQGYGMGLPDNPTALLATDNGGATWVVKTAHPPALFDAYAFSPSEGLAVSNGFRGTTPVAWVYRSQNGGATWHQFGGLPGVYATGLQYAGDATWVVTGLSASSSAKILEVSKNNGKTWHRAPLTLAAPDMVDVASATSAWVFTNADGSGRLVEENLAGTLEKTALTLPTSGPIQDTVNAIDFNNAEVGWLAVTQFIKGPATVDKPGHPTPVPAVKTENLLYTTSDGGVRWSLWELPAPWSITGLDVVNADTGYLIANGVLLKTTDGGAVWQVAAKP